MRENQGAWCLELPDLIRMNQLVRGRIDFDGFAAWYASLLPAQRVTLACCLCEFAHQAGVDGGTWDEALAASGLPPEHPVVRRLLERRRGGSGGLFGLPGLLTSLDGGELGAAFRLLAHLFGVAEGRVYQAETKVFCNHWWHRDLMDERVVQDLLSDPHFYQTSMRDDDRVKR